jgi:hypothetical protein
MTGQPPREPYAPRAVEAPAKRLARPGSSERLRWGLTGLAAIFLLVLVAAAGLRPHRRAERPGTGEPLAVLGVAPGPASRAPHDTAPNPTAPPAAAPQP